MCPRPSSWGYLMWRALVGSGWLGSGCLVLRADTRENPGGKNGVMTESAPLCLVFTEQRARGWIRDSTPWQTDGSWEQTANTYYIPRHTSRCRLVYTATNILEISLYVPKIFLPYDFHRFPHVFQRGNFFTISGCTQSKYALQENRSTATKPFCRTKVSISSLDVPGDEIVH
jgi:hypothetical protein